MSGSKILVLAKSDQYHPLETLGQMILNWLKDERLSNVALTSDRSVIVNDINKYDLVIACMTMNKLSPEEEKSFVDFVKNGRKFMGIHSATVVDESNKDYIEMIGGRFVRHSPYHEFIVKVADPGHPILEGLKDFKIQDELYVLDRTPSSASVLLTAFFNDHAQPMLYLRAHGEGKVLYNAMGHDTSAYENPNFRKIVAQGVKWLLK